MKSRSPILCVFLTVSFGCGVPSDSSRNSFASESAEPAIQTPTPENLPHIPVKPIRRLDREQTKKLDSTLPPKVREVLEKAEVLEVLGLSSERKAGIGWYPDVRVSLQHGSERTDLLNAFYYDASAGPNPSACFIPRHGLKATFNGKTVEVVICFQCHLFVVKGDLGKYEGGVYLDGSASHYLFEGILKTNAEPIN